MQRQLARMRLDLAPTGHIFTPPNDPPTLRDRIVVKLKIRRKIKISKTAAYEPKVYFSNFLPTWAAGSSTSKAYLDKIQIWNHSEYDSITDIGVDFWNVSPNSIVSHAGDAPSKTTYARFGYNWNAQQRAVGFNPDGALCLFTLDQRMPIDSSNPFSLTVDLNFRVEMDNVLSGSPPAILRLPAQVQKEVRPTQNLVNSVSPHHMPLTQESDRLDPGEYTLKDIPPD